MSDNKQLKGILSSIGNLTTNFTAEFQSTLSPEPLDQCQSHPKPAPVVHYAKKIEYAICGDSFYKSLPFFATYIWGEVTCPECLKHKPAPAEKVVHYHKGNGYAICGDNFYQNPNLSHIDNWSNVTCPDCLKHKPKLKPEDCVGRKIMILSTDFRGSMDGFNKDENFKQGNIYQCLLIEGNGRIEIDDGNQTWWFDTKDLECCELVEKPHCPKCRETEEQLREFKMLIDVILTNG